MLPESKLIVEKLESTLSFSLWVRQVEGKLVQVPFGFSLWLLLFLPPVLLSQCCAFTVPLRTKHCSSCFVSCDVILSDAELDRLNVPSLLF